MPTMDDELIEARFSLLEGRLDFHDQRLDSAESELGERDDDRKHAQGMRINWVVVGLFGVELVVGALQLWWVMRHA
jgi:hypothetical protein